MSKVCRNVAVCLLALSIPFQGFDMVNILRAMAAATASEESGPVIEWAFVARHIPSNEPQVHAATPLQIVLQRSTFSASDLTERVKSSINVAATSCLYYKTHADGQNVGGGVDRQVSGRFGGMPLQGIRLQI